ncbi:hypothetical protein [Luteimonas sp. FCS-9]|uniref:hypothetical protein n=1 Tax=Luteimonas sp. FCS-9 TaxID=1547516 RepID=UPI001E579324|nr:hypothetical protein [Luteimonas sp. FCS-9]
MPAEDAASASPPLRDARLAEGAVAGISQGEWTARWWRWAIGQWIAPYLDPDGRWCAVGQDPDSPVWFLAGTDGTFSPKRRCVVPEGKYLLVPVINTYFQDSGDAEAEVCAAAQGWVAVNNDQLLSAVAMLDGRPLGDVRAMRVRSDGCFRFDPEDPSVLSASDGYWLMIAPLPRGRHTLSIGANYAPGDTGYGGMHQNFEYTLDIGSEILLSVVAR